MNATGKFSIYADFQNVDPEGRIRLNTAGTLEDLARSEVALSTGLRVSLYTDDGDSDRGLSIPGKVEFNSNERIWVAVVKWFQLVRVENESLTTSRS